MGDDISRFLDALFWGGGEPPTSRPVRVVLLVWWVCSVALGAIVLASLLGWAEWLSEDGRRHALTVGSLSWLAVLSYFRVRSRRQLRRRQHRQAAEEERSRPGR